MSLRRHLPRPAIVLLTGVLAGLVAAGVVVAVRPAAAPPGATAAPTSPPEASDPCASAVAALAPRDRLAQRLVVGVDAADPATVVDTVRATQVGGIFIGGNATALLRDHALKRVQEVSRTPVAVSVDDEGGRVQRIDGLDGQLPSARRMAARSTPDGVRELARVRGKELAARGVTVDFAPVVDVGRQPTNSVIGDRAFSDDPAVVIRYAGAFAEGLRAGGVLPVLKHFPGHGRASGDSHKGRVTTPPLAELRTTDLRPYEQLPAAGRVAVMVGHLDVPGLTDGLPTSLTPAAYRLLREDYRFDGLVVTDDLGAMKAVTGTFTARSREGVLRAHRARVACPGSGFVGRPDTAGSVPPRLARRRTTRPAAASTAPRTSGGRARIRRGRAGKRARLAPANVPTRAGKGGDSRGYPVNRAIPRRTASTRYGRRSADGTIRCTEPMRWARSTLCAASNSAATSPNLSERTPGRIAASSAASRAASLSAPVAVAFAIRVSRSVTRGSAAVRLFTSPANTTAAAGAPPITEAYEPSTAATSIDSFSVPENTTNAPP